MGLKDQTPWLRWWGGLWSRNGPSLFPSTFAWKPVQGPGGAASGPLGEPGESQPEVSQSTGMLGPFLLYSSPRTVSILGTHWIYRHSCSSLGPLSLMMGPLCGARARLCVRIGLLPAV